MKILEKVLSLVGWGVMYIVPLLLFGKVMPYTHEALPAGLTAMGFVALGVLVLMVTKKLRDRVLSMPKSLKREAILLAFPVAWWAILYFALDAILVLLTNISAYWSKNILFIILGGLLCCISGAMAEDHGEKTEKNGETDKEGDK